MTNWEQHFGTNASDRKDLQGIEDFNASSYARNDLEVKDRACQRLQEAVVDYLQAGGSVVQLFKLIAELL